MRHLITENLAAIVIVIVALIGIMAVMTLFKIENGVEKYQLALWRKTLSVGDKVKVSDGAVVFNAQIVGFPNGDVRVISEEMRLAAYSIESIYPL